MLLIESTRLAIAVQEQRDVHILTLYPKCQCSKHNTENGPGEEVQVVEWDGDGTVEWMTQLEGSCSMEMSCSS